MRKTLVCTLSILVVALVASTAGATRPARLDRVNAIARPSPMNLSRMTTGSERMSRQARVHSFRAPSPHRLDRLRHKTDVVIGNTHRTAARYAVASRPQSVSPQERLPSRIQGAIRCADSAACGARPTSVSSSRTISRIRAFQVNHSGQRDGVTNMRRKMHQERIEKFLRAMAFSKTRLNGK